MTRPKKCRSVTGVPVVNYYKPTGISLRALEEITLTVDEFESLRLKDSEGLEQEAGAARMNVSRTTFQRILSAARQKVTDALLHGKAIRIEGGDFEVAGFGRQTARRNHWGAQHPRLGAGICVHGENAG